MSQIPPEYLLQSIGSKQVEIDLLRQEKVAHVCPACTLEHVQPAADEPVALVPVVEV